MSDVLKKHDAWLTDDTTAALVLREHLMPVEGADGVIFPATFAAGDNFPGGYNIDRFSDGSDNVCLIDSVGAQANRIEPLFMRPEFASLVPQVTIKAGDKVVNLLEAGHRAGDAIVRCTKLQRDLQSAFKSALAGDAVPLAKIAPTSLVFGVWDSRDTQAKSPRLLSSTIRAFSVRPLTRSAQYIPPVDYVAVGLVDESLDVGKGKANPLAQKGFKHNPASAAHGGVIADGGIRRDAVVSLAALRLLSAGADKDQTLALRRYIFGLSLVALTARPATYLRQGCNLVLDPDKKTEFVEVRADGKRIAASITPDAAITYAEAAAKAFGVGEHRNVQFDPELAKRDLEGDGENSQAAKKGRKSKA